MKIALAFDIERAGATDQYDTIAIGASVLDENYKELDSLFLPGYFPKETIFQSDCKENFWDKHIKILDTLTYKGTMSYDERQKDMIVRFQEFRCKWETWCLLNNHDLILVSDNCVYDGGFINIMIYKHMTGTLPIPYEASGKQKYAPFQETGCILQGILKIIDPKFKKDRGHKYRIGKLFDLPKKKKPNDHNPSNDAYGIAYDWQVSNGISNKTIKLKES